MVEHHHVALGRSGQPHDRPPSLCVERIPPARATEGSVRSWCVGRRLPSALVDVGLPSWTLCVLGVVLWAATAWLIQRALATPRWRGALSVEAADLGSEWRRARASAGVTSSDRDTRGLLSFSTPGPWLDVTGPQAEVLTLMDFGPMTVKRPTRTFPRWPSTTLSSTGQAWADTPRWRGRSSHHWRCRAKVAAGWLALLRADLRRARRVLDPMSFEARGGATGAIAASHRSSGR